MTWSHGYFTDLSYTHGYYRELNPLMLRMASVCAGVEANLRNPPAYLELGFGQGVSINIHAAATEGSYWGTDFDPAHAVHARELATASGHDARLFDQSFQEIAVRPDLPDFDFIVLHGVWSWVSESNREAIIGIVRRKLRPGGLVYISYNCLPGWAPAIPIRNLLTLYGEYGGGQMAGACGAIDGAVQFSSGIVKAGSIYFRENPWAAHHFERVLTQNRNYLAHEYLNDDWHLLHFSDMMRTLEEAKLSYVGPARLLDGIDSMHLTPEGQKFLSGIANPILRETVRDYLVNQRFRCDVFAKGARPLSGPRQREAWHAQPFVLTTCHEDIPKTITTTLGEIELPERIYDPIIDALSRSNYEPKRIEELVALPQLRTLNVNEIVEALIVLTGAGFVSPAQTPTKQNSARCNKLNRHIRRRALGGTELTHLASPLTGGGIFVPHVYQMFMLALEQGKGTAQDLACFVWEFLDGVGERLIKDGQRVEAKEENIKEFTAMANTFLNRKRPLLQALAVM
ncbi:MAG: methyltransferase domain-containing protein [Mesorhizobium sp.]|uniref:class I SAM-dependent methyltransferase n=1 Tax=Mesorhizobium sp. TaxID=1871066 RepID=UPI000FE6D9FB|nr:class I SAM-dependent methyltransferase [Mesorhizobium sp.]RWI50298.1 MAG: methyltransferase domain-containing protein [Mesorhizobium sp.]